MIVKFSVIVLLVFVSVSGQQRPGKINEEYGQPIYQVRGQKISPPTYSNLPTELNPDEMIIKPCLEPLRRSMPVNTETEKETSNKLESQNSATSDQKPSTEKLESVQQKIQPAPSSESDNLTDFDIEPSSEEADRILKHFNTVHSQYREHKIPVKDNGQKSPSSTSYHNEPAIKLHNSDIIDDHLVYSDEKGSFEDTLDPHIHTKPYLSTDAAPDGEYQYGAPSNQKARRPHIHCIQSDTEENIENDDNDFEMNSRRSMGEDDNPIIVKSPSQKEDSQNEQDILSDNSETPTANKDDLRRNSPSRGGIPVYDPTKGSAVVPLKNSPLAVAASSRVCYACTSINDPTCHLPKRGTTVKYCRPSHDSCLTKTVKGPYNNDLIVIRDCGSSCKAASSAPLVDLRSCSICKGDLCNKGPADSSGAISFTTFSCTSMIIIATWLVKFAI